MLGFEALMLKSAATTVIGWARSSAREGAPKQQRSKNTT
jgi:hypothetical protein